MSVKTRLEDELKLAMKARDDRRKRTLRLALTAVKLAEVAKQESLQDADILAILQKEVKARRESIADAEKAGRADLTAEAEAEIRILEDFLPQMLSEQELYSLAREAIEEVSATSIKEMGKVMKVLMPRVKGRAEGGQVSGIVRQILMNN